MKPLFEDTPPVVENRLIEGYRSMTPRLKRAYADAGLQDIPAADPTEEVD